MCFIFLMQNIMIIFPKYTENMECIYIWQREDWPFFTWDDSKLYYKLGRVRGLQGKFVGKMSVLGFELKNSAMLDALRLISQNHQE